MNGVIENVRRLWRVEIQAKDTFCFMMTKIMRMLVMNKEGEIKMILPEINTRRSIRKYKDKPVEEHLIRELIEAAILAPSGSNTQPWHFIIVRDEKVKQEVIAADHYQQWMFKAPVLIACVSDIECRIKDSQALRVDEKSSEEEVKQIVRDSAVAIENLLLQAEHLGLGTCWTAWFEQKEMKAALRVPDNKYVCGVICVGYADEMPSKRSRKAFEDIVHYEVW